MSESIPVQSANNREELLKQIAEQGNNPPTTDEFLRGFDEKRAQLQAQLEQNKTKYGGVLNSAEILARDTERRRIESEIAEINSVWKELGGENVDSARRALAELDFRSDARDRSQANADRVAAENTAYANFKQAYAETNATESPETVTDSEETDKSDSAEVENEGLLSPEQRAELESVVAEDKQLEQSQDSTGGEREGLLSPEQRAELQKIVDEHGEKEGLLSDEQRAELERIVAEGEMYTNANWKFANGRELGVNDSANLEKQLEQEAELNAGLDAALKRYAAAKADAETITGFGFGKWRVGANRRAEALKQAEDELFNAQLEVTEFTINRRTEQGNYVESEDAERQAEDDFFDEMRSLDSQALAATRRERTSRIENRNGFQRGLAAVGKFLNGGKTKKASWLRNAGPGALMGVGTVLSGAGWPIALLAAAGVKGAAGAGSRMNTLDEQFAARAGEKSVLADDEFDNLRRSLDGDREAKARTITDETFAASRERGDLELGRARAKAAKNMLKFGVGFGVGVGVASIGKVIAGNLTESAVYSGANGSEAGGSHTVGVDGSHATGADASGGNGGPEITSHQADGSHFHGHEFQADASHISRGEGFYHQFHDMGITREQSRQLFADKTLMNKLVEQGAAYVDKSPKIGGYGINMPKSGHFSAETMETIRQSIIEHGFSNK